MSAVRWTIALIFLVLFPPLGLLLCFVSWRKDRFAKEERRHRELVDAVAARQPAE